jgi:hypothetical protein
MDVIGSLADLCTLSIVVPSGAQARGPEHTRSHLSPVGSQAKKPTLNRKFFAS